MAEQVFLQHLRSIYAKDSGVSVKISDGKGSTPLNVVIAAANTPGAFQKRYVVLDDDKSTQEMALARVAAKKRNIIILENSPCLESTLLKILQPQKDFSVKTSSWCKKEFESKFLDKKKRTDLAEYNRIFPKVILDTQKINVPILGTLIDLMHGVDQ